MPTPQSKEKMLERIRRENDASHVNPEALAEVLAELSEGKKRPDNLRDNDDGSCNCRPFGGGCFFIGPLGGPCNCKCHKPAPDSLEEEFDELQFATCPTEEQEPFFWKWRHSAKQYLLSFLREKVKEAEERGRSGALNEVQIIVDEHNENCDPRYHAECLPIIKEKLTLIRNKK